MTSLSLAWLIQAQDGQIFWFDLSCQSCTACLAGLPGRCAAPLGVDTLARDRVHVITGPAQVDTAALGAAAVALDLVLAAAFAGPAVLLTGAGSLLADVGQLLDAAGVRPLVLHGDVPPGTMLPVVGEDDVRAAFSGLRPSQRPDIVLSVEGDLHTAAQLVRRGGAIGATGRITQDPPFAAVVQRELTVLAPRDPVSAARLLRMNTAEEREAV